MHDRHEKFINLVFRPKVKGSPERSVHRWGITLRWILKEWLLRAEFIRLRTGNAVGLRELNLSFP